MPDLEAQRAAMKKLQFLAGKWAGEARLFRGPGGPVIWTQTEEAHYKLDGLGAKPRRRSWLRKQSAQTLQTAIKTRVVSTGRRGGPSWTTSASGETLERRLWALQREARRARPGARNGGFSRR